RDLRDRAVHLAGADGVEPFLLAVAAEHDELLCAATDGDAGGVRGLDRGHRLVVGHAVDRVEPAGGGEARIELAGEPLAGGGVPPPILDRRDLDLRIARHRLLEAGDAARTRALLQRAGDQRHLATVAAAVLERLHRDLADDAAHLVLILPDEGDIEILRTVL